MFFSCIEDEYLEVHLLFPLLHSSKQVLSLHHSTNVHTNDRVNTISLLEIAEHCFQHFSPCDTTIIYSVVYFALKWPLSCLTSFIFFFFFFAFFLFFLYFLFFLFFFFAFFFFTFFFFTFFFLVFCFLAFFFFQFFYFFFISHTFIIVLFFFFFAFFFSLFFAFRESLLFLHSSVPSFDELAKNAYAGLFWSICTNPDHVLRHLLH